MRIWTQTTDDCVSETPVEAGAMRYMGRTDATGKCVAHVVTALTGTRRVYDPEYRCWQTNYGYRSRLATEKEVAEYLALPRSVCSTWRAS